MSLVKSKDRVRDFGEVFTPSWLVNEMLALVPRELERIDSRFLETACGSGNFLVAILLKKLDVVDSRYGSNEFEKQHHGLLALMSIYGIELQEDNAVECREILLQVFTERFKIDTSGDLYQAAKKVLSCNIVIGDALKFENQKGSSIVFAEWAYLGQGNYQRRDFMFSELVQMASFGEGTLFENMQSDQIFRPIAVHPKVNFEGISQLEFTN